MGLDKGSARRRHHSGGGGRGCRPTAVGGSEGRATAPGRSVLRCVLRDPRADPVSPSRDLHATWNYRTAAALSSTQRLVGGTIEEEIQQILKLVVIELSNNNCNNNKNNNSVHLYSAFLGTQSAIERGNLLVYVLYLTALGPALSSWYQNQMAPSASATTKRSLGVRRSPNASGGWAPGLHW